MDFRIRPLADRVVIKPQEREEKTRGGLFLPDTASKEKPQEGLVMAVGEGRLDDNGKRVAVSVKNGDRYCSPSMPAPRSSWTTTII